jgi:hypothetical protein
VFVLLPFVDSGAPGGIGHGGADDEKSGGHGFLLKGLQVPLRGNLFWLTSKSLNPMQTWSGFRR